MAHAPTPAMLLRADVRLFGDILGRVLAAEEGEAVFRAIEAIRQASVAYHREGTPERAARLDELLQALSLPDALRFAHSFVVLLAAHQHRRGPGRAAAPARRRRTPSARWPARSGGWRARASTPRRCAPSLDHALVMPVITAHPSEVRRKSVIDRVSRIAETFDAYDRATPDARAPIEADLAAADPDPLGDAAAAPDQPRRRRRDRQRRLVLRAHLPAASCRGSTPTWRRRWASGPRIPSFLRIGSWVGGDRDGNPNVTAETLRLAFLTQSRLVVGHYLEEIHALGAALSLSHRAREGDARAGRRWPSDRATTSPQRADEPYRRALSGIYARLAAAAPALTGAPPARPSPIAGAPYAVGRRAEGRPAGASRTRSSATTARRSGTGGSPT